MDDLLQEFVAETRETLEALTSEIVAWEADPGDRTRFDAIFRFVHTVKGSCGFLDLPRLARLSHAAEDVLAAVRDGNRVADAALVDAVLAIIDRIGELVEAIDAGTALDDSAEDMLILALDGAAHRVPDTAPEAASDTAVAAAPVRHVTRSVRLSVDLLDRMMGGVSEMVLARNELARIVRECADPALETAFERLSARVGDLRETVTRTRMQRVEALFAPLQRLVRDTAATLDKVVVLTIEGGDVELDREMIELMRDPLVHMVRNAIDHGLETPADRRAAGKGETGQLRVSARQSGNRIMIEITDDGRGIDVGRVAQKAITADPSRAAMVRAMTPAEQAMLVFEPGLSSRDQVNELSGRGVGMDVVRANVEQIGGRIDLRNRPGHGLSVAIEVPLTLSILSALIVRSGAHAFAIPRQGVEEIVSASARAVRIDAVGEASLVTIRGRRMPMVRLTKALGIATGEDAVRMLVILAIPGGQYALAVDDVVDEEELVVKPAAPIVMASGFYAGQTLPDDGRPMLLLDGNGIAARAGVKFDRREEATVNATVEQAQEPGTAALLFVDLDGQHRVIALAAIDRIERVATRHIAHRGGGWRMATDTVSLLVVAVAPFDTRAEVSLLRLHDPEIAVGYAIDQALDIVHLADALVPARAPGRVAGVVTFAGDTIEVIDPLWLLGEAEPSASAARPVCLLHGAESGWMETFLRPTIEAAGYRVVRRLSEDEAAAVTLVMEGETAEGTLIRLSRQPGAGLYRYDRAGVAQALGATVAR